MSEAKNVYEQLADLQKQLAELQAKPKTVSNLASEDAPVLIDFVKRAKRIWRYSGEKSELQRENRKKRKRSIVALCLLAVYLIVSFLFVTKPWGWILPIFSSIACLCQGLLQFFLLKPKEYELPYERIPSFWRYAELDDNGIVCATKDKWWVIALRIALLLTAIALGVEIILFLEGFWKIAGYVMIILCSVLLLPFKDTTIYGYRLHFVDDKNDVTYHLLKDFMKRNNLK